MEDIGSARPSVCFEVQKIIGVSSGNGNMRNYQVQWAPTWVSGFNLVGCGHLIEEFIKQQSEKNQLGDNTITTTTGVTDSDDLVIDTRQDVSTDNVPQFTSEDHSEDHSEEEIYDEASMVVNSFSKNQESNSCLYSNTSNNNRNVKVETSMETKVSNEEIRTSDIDANDETNSNFEWVKIEDVDGNEDTQEDDTHSLPFVYKNPHLVDADTSGCAAVEVQPNCIQEFQNNVPEIEGEEIMLEQFTETDQDRLNNDYGDTSNSTENMLLDAGEMLNTYIECNTSQKSHLNSDLYFHPGQKTYQFKDCSKLFPRKDTLEKPSRLLHKTDKPYICVECNKTFKQRSHFKEHVRLHSGERPFNCGECDKSFLRKHHLTVHQRLHTDDKPYKCGECNKSFSWKHSLTVHKRHHTGEKPYMCPQCNKRFSDGSNLRQHLQRCKEVNTYNY